MNERPPDRPQNDALIGMTLGGCRIDALLGRGGMGVVYRAHHLALDKTVALKLLSPQLESEPGFVDRFVREAQAAARVEHPNVVRVLDVAEENGQHYIVMQFVDGESLEGRLAREGKLASPIATRIVRDVAGGLRALHAEGIVHRDIKPANILLGKDGGGTITDFGLARNVKARSGQTVAGTFMGTPEFVAPEQVLGPVVDHRADLYSLGVTYYYMLSGALPFEALSPMGMATQQVKADPIPLHGRVPDLDPRILEIVNRLLRKDPKDRFQDAEGLGSALESVLGGAPSSTLSAAQDTAGSPVIAVKGRRIPPPASAPAVSAEDPAPKILAGPKKRVVDGGPVVPREIAPLPPPPPRRLPPEASPSPPPPPPPEPVPPAPRPAPPKKLSTESQIPSKPTPRRSTAARRLGSAVPTALFWVFVGAGGALLYGVGALGAPYRNGSFWEDLPQPFVHDDGARLLRWVLAGLALGAYVLAFVTNRNHIQNSPQPGAVIMLPIFSGLCFYAGGLVSPLQGLEGPLLVRAARGTMHSLVHPCTLAPLAVWGLLGGVVEGTAPGAARPGKLLGAVMVLASIAALFVFAAGSELRETMARLKGDPGQAWPAAASGVGALVGSFLAFGRRAGLWRRAFGVMLVAGSAVLVVLRGVTPRTSAVTMAGDSLENLPAILASHGASVLLGGFLLYWTAWFLRRFSK